MANVITASGDKSPSLEYVFDRGRTMSTTAQSSTRQPNRTNKRVLVATGCAVGLLLFWQQLLFRSIMPSAPELSVTILGNVRTDAGWLVFVVSLAILPSFAAFATTCMQGPVCDRVKKGLPQRTAKPGHGRSRLRAYACVRDQQPRYSFPQALFVFSPVAHSPESALRSAQRCSSKPYTVRFPATP